VEVEALGAGVGKRKQRVRAPHRAGHRVAQPRAAAAVQRVGLRYAQLQPGIARDVAQPAELFQAKVLQALLEQALGVDGDVVHVGVVLLFSCSFLFSFWWGVRRGTKKLKKQH
jgi:hypothetical protein